MAPLPCRCAGGGDQPYQPMDVTGKADAATVPRAVRDYVAAAAGKLAAEDDQARVVALDQRIDGIGALADELVRSSALADARLRSADAAWDGARVALRGLGDKDKPDCSEAAEQPLDCSYAAELGALGALARLEAAAASVELVRQLAPAVVVVQSGGSAVAALCDASLRLSGPSLQVDAVAVARAIVASTAARHGLCRERAAPHSLRQQPNLESAIEPQGGDCETRQHTTGVSSATVVSSGGELFLAVSFTFCNLAPCSSVQLHSLTFSSSTDDAQTVELEEVLLLPHTKSTPSYSKYVHCVPLLELTPWRSPSNDLPTGQGVDAAAMQACADWAASPRTQQRFRPRCPCYAYTWRYQELEPETVEPHTPTRPSMWAALGF